MKMDEKDRHLPGLEELERTLLTLNYRLTLRALNAWKGDALGASGHDLYSGYEELLQPEVIKAIRDAGGPLGEGRKIFHTLLGHYLQYRVLPYDSELSMWLRGAAAQVSGEKIYFKDILTWCQKRSNFENRRIIEKETSSLSKFLKPFALGSWDVVLELLEEEFGYPDYVAYCRDKKGVDYTAYVQKLEVLLEQTGPFYFDAMERWVRGSLGVPLSDLNRFDAIYLLGLGQFDTIYPDHIPLKDHLQFFHNWGIDAGSIAGIHLDIEYSPRKGSQAMSFALRIPDEIHLVMNPQGGWIDLETLFHEMGHVLHNTFTSPHLPPVDKDFFTSNTLSETFAFLLQNMCFTPYFLERQLKLKPDAVERIMYYKALKDMSLFRRYAAKFLSEYHMFQAGETANGEIYASMMHEHTGFSYLPETHIFDLVPEFYSLDYVMSWMAEVTVEKAMAKALGPDWMYRREAAETLKKWWMSGNKYDLEEFLRVNGLGDLGFDDIVGRWNSRISGDPPW